MVANGQDVALKPLLSTSLHILDLQGGEQTKELTELAGDIGALVGERVSPQHALQALTTFQQQQQR